MVSVSLCITGTYSTKSSLFFFLIEQITSLVTVGHSLTPSSVFEIFDAALTWSADPHQHSITCLPGREGLASVVLGEGCVGREEKRKSKKQKIIGRNRSARWTKEAPEKCWDSSQEEAEQISFLSTQELNNVRSWRKRFLLWLLLLSGKKVCALSP